MRLTLAYQTSRDMLTVLLVRVGKQMGFMASSRDTTKPSVLNQGPPAKVNLMDKIIGIETFFYPQL